MSIVVGILLKLGMSKWTWIILGVLGVYLYGQHNGREGCERRVERAVAAEQTRQATINETVTAAAEKRADEAEAAAAEKDKEIASYEAELAKLGSAACTLDGSDVERLRSILR